MTRTAIIAPALLLTTVFAGLASCATMSFYSLALRLPGVILLGPAEQACGQREPAEPDRDDHPCRDDGGPAPGGRPQAHSESEDTSPG